MSYIGKQPVPQSLQSRQQFTGDGSTTTFATIGGVELYEDVFLNGVRLSRVDNEYSFDGTTLTITPAPANGDTVSIILRNDHSELIALPITDSAGNNVLSESAGVVTLTADEANVGSNALIVDSSGNVVINESGADADFRVKSITSSGALFLEGSSGNVGVGLGAPQEKLQVLGNIHALGSGSGNGTYGPYIAIGKANGPKISSTQENADDDIQGLAFFTKSSATGSNPPFEAMRINSSGKVLIGTTAEVYDSDTPVHVKQTNTSSGNNACLALQNMNATSASGVRTILFMNSSGDRSGNINQSNTTISVNSSSDYRLKENITKITDGITRVKKLNPSRFNFIVNPDNTVDGFIAHQVSDIVPEAVSGEKDAVNEDGSIDPQGIDQSKLVPLLTAALQEAITLIESQQSQIDALTTKTQEQDLTIASLISRIEALEAPAE